MNKISFLLFIILILFSCNNNENNVQNKQTISVSAKNLIGKLKYQPGDPFIETIKKSEYFKISGLENHILETKEGTIISIPKGAFRDKNGNLVEKEVVIELTDIKNFEDQILSNITSQQGGKVLQSGGSIYINATQNGEQLTLNQDNPIYIETNVNDPESDYLIFEGIRNDNGEMQWINPTKPKKYLIPVELDELDFLPEGFALAVEKGMPFKNHKTANKELIDSLYYSLSPYIESPATPLMDEIIETETDSVKYSFKDTTVSEIPCKGIDPASIKVLKTKKYSKTFISTRDFEKRLKEIRKSNYPELLDVYINNLNFNMSKCDSLIVNKLPSNNNSRIKFIDFAHENLGNIKNLPNSVIKLGEYYSKKLKETKENLEEIRNNYQKELNKKEKQAIEIENEYKNILSQRLKYRLNKFGFEVKKLGWTNIARMLEPLEKFKLEIKVKNGNSFDRVNVYTIDQRINSIFALTSTDNILFNRGYNEDSILLYNKFQNAISIVVAYKDSIPYYALKEFIVTPEIYVLLSPVQSTTKELKTILRKLDNLHKSFNKLQVDLEFQALFYKEKIRKENLRKEKEFINSLRKIAFNCQEIKYSHK